MNWEQIIEAYPAPPEVDKFKVNNSLLSLKQKVYKANNGIPELDITSPRCKLVNKYMIDEYRLTPAGGHHHAIYKFMVKVCYKARDMDYPISVEELASMGEQLDEMDGGWYNDKKLMSSAKCAIEYVF